MKVLLTGATGQVGYEILRSKPKNIEIFHPNRDQLDLSDYESCKNIVLENKPDWIINTSCEHMSTLWFDAVDNDQLVIMQTNNSEEFDGHINPCYNVKEMQEKYPLTNIVYIGELVTPAYTRYMQIVYK